jgi:solute carrier family 25 oxoglutarate transporter 11
MNKGAAIPLVQKAGAGLAAGGLGAIFGSPADLSLIRMQARAGTFHHHVILQ